MRYLKQFPIRNEARNTACALALFCLISAAAHQASAQEPGTTLPEAQGTQQPNVADPPLSERLRANEAKLHLPVPANPKLPTLWLVGDSTVRNGHGDGAGGQWGWGEPLVDFFDPAKVNVVNRAIGGLSSRTFITEGHWEEDVAMMKPGDIVLIQFGHNITDARAKGATPILCTLIPRKTWKDGKIVRNDDTYAGWTRTVAKEEKVQLIDLNERIAARYDALGQEKVEPLFGDPHTHTSRAGAELNAEVVVQGLKALKPDPVKKFFSAKGKAVPAK